MKPPLRRLGNYLIAPVAVLITAWVRHEMTPYVDGDMPLLLFVFPIAMCAWLGGLGPGLLATAMSAIAGGLLFLPRNEAGALSKNSDVIRVCVLLFQGVVISILSENLIRNRRKAGRELEERLLKEASLRSANETIEFDHRLLNTLLEALPVGVSIADGQGKIVRSNDAVRRIWRGAREIQGIEDYSQYKGSWPHSSEHLRSEDWAMARALTKREFCPGEVVEIERFDGTRGTILNTGAPLVDKNGQLIGAVVAMVDISDLQSVSKALVASEERFRRAITFAPFPIMLHADDGEVLLVNQAWEQLSGFTRNDIPHIAKWSERGLGDSSDERKRQILSLHDAEEVVDEGECLIHTTRQGRFVMHG